MLILKSMCAQCLQSFLFRGDSVMTQSGKFTASAIALAVITGGAMAISALVPTETATAGAEPQATAPVVPSLVQPTTINQQSFAYQQPQAPVVNLPVAYQSQGYYNQPLANAQTTAPATPSGGVEAVATSQGNLLQMQAPKDVQGRYSTANQQEAQIFIVDGAVQALDAQVDVLVATKSFDGLASGTLEPTVRQLNEAARKMNAKFNMQYAGIDGRLDDTFDENGNVVVPGLLSDVAGNTQSIADNAGKIVSLGDDLTHVKDGINTFVKDNKLQRYAFSNYVKLDDHFAYNGVPGMQSNGAYCDESEDLRSLMVYSTHKAVHCMVNITGDPNEMLWVVYKGRYPKVDGSMGTEVSAVEDGAIFKSVVPYLRWNNVGNSQIQAMVRTLGDPDVYKRPVRTPSEVAGTRVTTVKANSIADKSASLPVIESPQAKIERLNGAKITAGDNVSLASLGSNSGVAGKDNHSVRVVGANEVNLSIAR
jgi:hypothetical protein